MFENQCRRTFYYSSHHKYAAQQNNPHCLAGKKLENEDMSEVYSCSKLEVKAKSSLLILFNIKDENHY